MNVLIVVDMQNDFVSGALGTPEAREIVPRVVDRVEEGIRRGEKILFTRDTHETDYLNTQEGKKLPVPHCIRGTGGWEIVEPLQKYAEHPIDKPTFGSQYLGALLKARDEDLRRQGEPGPLYRYLRDFQRPSSESISSGERHCRRCFLLCRRDAGEPPGRPGCHGALPDHSGERDVKNRARGRMPRARSDFSPYSMLICRLEETSAVFLGSFRSSTPLS